MTQAGAEIAQLVELGLVAREASGVALLVVERRELLGRLERVGLLGGVDQGDRGNQRQLGFMG